MKTTLLLTLFLYIYMPAHAKDQQNLSCPSFIPTVVKADVLDRYPICYINASSVDYSDIIHEEEYMEPFMIPLSDKRHLLLRNKDKAAIYISEDSFEGLRLLPVDALKGLKLKPKIAQKQKNLRMCRKTCAQEFFSESSAIGKKNFLSKITNGVLKFDKAIRSNLGGYACFRKCEKLYPVLNDEDNVGAFLSGNDMGVESGFLIFTGTVKLNCTDEKGYRHHAVYQKVCGGAFAGVGLSAHVLGNVHGKRCHGAYEGSFWEASLGIGVNINGFIGSKDKHGNRVKMADKVSGGGVGLSLSPLPFSVAKCKYYLIDEFIDYDTKLDPINTPKEPNLYELKDLPYF